MAYSIEKMITEEEVNNRIRELGEEITRDYKGRSVRLVCILRGAVFFMCELAKRIELPVSFDFMSGSLNVSLINENIFDFSPRNSKYPNFDSISIFL